MPMPLWVVAALVAALLSLGFTSLGREKALRWQAWRSVLAVTIFDFASGIGAYRLASLAALPMTPRPGIWVACVAGITGPGLLRARAPKALHGRIGDWHLFGPLRALQEKAEADVDRICTAEETNWLNTVLKELDPMTLEEVANWTVRYLTRMNRGKSSDRRVDFRRTKLIRQVGDALKDSHSSEYIRKKTVVQILLDEGGYRAVRGLIRQANSVAPDRLVGASHLPRRLTLGRLERKLSVPPRFRIDRLEGRIRIGYPDRRVDDDLRRLAYRLKGELAGRAKVDGLYEGWIVVSPLSDRRDRRRYTHILSQFSDKLRNCAKLPSMLVQLEATIMDGHSGCYANVGLVVASGDAPRHSDEFCSDAFTGGGVWLAGEIAIGGWTKDSHVYKPAMYATAMVPIYVIVDLEDGKVILHTLPSDGVYSCVSSITLGDKLRLPLPFDADIDTTILGNRELSDCRPTGQLSACATRFFSRSGSHKQCTKWCV